jgi:hypothetical protein
MDYGLSWITSKYPGLSGIIVDSCGFSWIIIDYHRLWIKLPWTVMDYHGLWNIPKHLKAKAVMTAQRYGASMAHPTPFRGHGLLWMIMDNGLSQII